MRCGNQETCEDYKKYVESNKEKFPKDKYDEIIKIITPGNIASSGNRYNNYYCMANSACSTVRTINLLEKISAETGGKNKNA